MITRTQAKWALAGIAATASLCAYNHILSDVSDVVGSTAIRSLARRRNKVKVPKPPKKKLVWLMGYPNAGTDETMNLVEQSTLLSMGTNYGEVMQTSNMKFHYTTYPSESIQEEWFDTGPFKNNVDFPMSPENVLVKTYCTGYCLFEEDCSRINYVRNMMNLKRWWQSCSKSRSYDPDRKKKVAGEKAYNKNQVRDVVIVYRNPVDMVTSRYKEYTVGKREWAFNPNGLYKYCAMVDEERGKVKEIKNYLKRRFIRLGPVDVATIPCYTEFLRIFWFYENVLALTANRQNKHFLAYDRLKTRYRKYAPPLLDFIGLKENKKGEKLFSGDGIDPQFFTPEDLEKINALYLLISKDRSRSWDLFQTYFE